MNEGRRLFCMATMAGTVLLLPKFSQSADNESGQADQIGIFTAIDTRRSIRAFTSEPVSDEAIQQMLKAAMMAPSAANEQPWEFVVIREKEILDHIGDINHYATYAAKAPLAILVCLNKNKEKIMGMGIIDVSMSAENLLLAATGLQLGAVFTGIYPLKERMDKFAELFNLPDHILPIGLIIIGHPLHKEIKMEPGRFNPQAIHYGKWQKGQD